MFSCPSFHAKSWKPIFVKFHKYSPLLVSLSGPELESPDNGRTLLCFPHSGISLQSLESKFARISKKDILKTPLPGDPFSDSVRELENFGPASPRSSRRLSIEKILRVPDLQKRTESDSVKRHLSRRHLSVLNLNSILFPMVGAPAKNKLHSH